MPSPYTIEQTADMSGLSVKFIRRMKEAMPQLFEKHTERGQSNALLFDEEIVEVLKRTASLKNRGRTLRQIRDELSARATEQKEKERSEEVAISPDKAGETSEKAGIIEKSLERENTLLRSQLSLLQTLLQKADERFDRLLPQATESKEKKPSMKSQMLMWLVEAVVVTSFAAGFIFLIWLFAQRAFSL